MASLVSTYGVVVGLLAGMMVMAKPLKEGETKEDYLMPNVQPQIKDSYLCYPRKMSDAARYITGFIPHANMSTAHHMLLYGCTEPGETNKVWNCGEMQVENPTYETGPVCKDGAKIIYAWAMDAPELHLPQDVAFKVGGDTDIKWLVLQVHYLDVSSFQPPKNGKDHSGITMISTSIPQPKRAGVYLLETDGVLPPHARTYMETACSFDDNIVIHPFAFRTHAHGHGEVVAGYRVRDGQWEEIGRISPQKPQMFYNVTLAGMTVKKGDTLAARCTMNNEEDRTIKIGSTSNDEMCNFYIMYWVNGNQIMDENYCFSAGPPHWYWNDMKSIHSENAPIDASIIPGSKALLKATDQILTGAKDPMDEASDGIRDQFLHLLQQIQADNPPQYEPRQFSDQNMNEMPTSFNQQEDAYYNYPLDLDDELNLNNGGRY